MRRWLLVCVVLATACKKHEPAKQEPPPDPRNPSLAELPWFDDLPDPPVTISNVSVKQATLRGYDRSLPVRFTITGKKPIPDRTTLVVKASCRVGGLVMASAVPATIELRQLEANQPQQVDAIPFGTDGFVGDTRLCELGFFLDRQEPGTKPARFKSACWTGGSVTSGRCMDLVPRTGVAPFTLSSADARLDADQLRLDVTIITGPHRAGDEQVTLQTRCEIAGKVVAASADGLANLRFLSAGEAFRITGAVPAAAPTWCELSVVIGATTLGQRCLRDGKLTDGAC